MKISIIGSGNVATHLAIAFFRAGHDIVDVCSPSPGHAQALASEVRARAVTQPSQLDPAVDLCLIAVRDDVIADVAAAVTLQRAILVHTAGSVSLEVLSSHRRIGVFYPFQTFSKGRQLDVAQIPFCLEAGDPETLDQLKMLVESLDATHHELNSAERKALHVAAVFACNFTNHLYALASELLREKGMPFDLLKPLIEETAGKIKERDPLEAQTGPAVRNDLKVINEHLKLLQDKPEFREVYRLLSASISKMHQG